MKVVTVATQTDKTEQTTELLPGNSSLLMTGPGAEHCSSDDDDDDDDEQTGLHLCLFVCLFTGNTYPTMHCAL